MYKNFIKALFLLPIFFLALFYTASGQETIRFRTVRASTEDELTYQQHFKAYTLATLNTESVTALLRSKDYFSGLSLEVNNQVFQFSLIAYDVRDANYKLQALTENGIIEYPRSPNKTWSGYTQGNHHDVRITADEDFFHALIVQAHDALYIEPARDIVPSAPADQFVIGTQHSRRVLCLRSFLACFLCRNVHKGLPCWVSGSY